MDNTKRGRDDRRMSIAIVRPPRAANRGAMLGRTESQVERRADGDDPLHGEYPHAASPNRGVLVGRLGGGPPVGAAVSDGTVLRMGRAATGEGRSFIMPRRPSSTSLPPMYRQVEARNG